MWGQHTQQVARTRFFHAFVGSQLLLRLYLGLQPETIFQLEETTVTDRCNISQQKLIKQLTLPNFKSSSILYLLTSYPTFELATLIEERACKI